MAISDYLTSLVNDRNTLVTNLTAKGITGLVGDETFTELVPEVLNIPTATTPDWVPDYNIVSATTLVLASNVWTDGDNIYYSNGSDQYILDKSTSTWSAKTWTGLTSFNGSNVWVENGNIYLSNGSTEYVLDKSTSNWSTHFSTNIYGSEIWTDGEKIYYSSGSTQLYRSYSSWGSKTWTGLTRFSGSNVWTDGDNIYYSKGSDQYILDKSTSTWSAKTWTGLTSFNGSNVWTDGDNIYYSSNVEQYILDKSTSTWFAKSWTGCGFPSASLFTDGTNIHCWSGNCYFTYKKVEGNIPKIPTRCKPVMPAPTT